MTVKRSSQILAFIAYALWIVGWFIVMIFGRRDRFAAYHARQSLALSLAVIIAPLLWLVVGWGVAWIPLVGPVLWAASFSLVIGLAVLALIAWIYGMIHAARAQVKPLPFFGDWARRLPA
jgi:uncharacterized membrane protein